MNRPEIIFKLLENKAKYIAIQIIAIHQDLTLNYKEFYLSQKLIENGTILGEKIAEMSLIPPKGYQKFCNDHIYPFINKTHYWLGLLVDSGKMDETLHQFLVQELNQLETMLQENTRLNAPDKPLS